MGSINRKIIGKYTKHKAKDGDRLVATSVSGKNAREMSARAVSDSDAVSHRSLEFPTSQHERAQFVGTRDKRLSRYWSENGQQTCRRDG